MPSKTSSQRRLSLNNVAQRSKPCDANEDHMDAPFLLENFTRARQVVHRDFIARAAEANTEQALGPFELLAPALPLPPTPLPIPPFSIVDG